MLCGILHPSRGIIKVLGMNPQREREKVVRSIGALFGHKSQLPINLKAKDAVEIVSMYYDVEKIDFEERFWKLAKLLEIEELAERRVRTLSLGERMRFELIASLIHNPKILLLDEPTIGLDFAAKAKIRKLIRSLGKTVLFTSHDALDIEAICERVIIMITEKF
jgi:ABC-2 type transport system ATP-binding protein